MSAARQERIEGAIWGLLVGDALGVPYEFAPPQRIPALAKIEMDPPVDFLRAHHGVRTGTWSDDGAQALCVLASLLDKGVVDAPDLMDRFARWFRDGYMAVGRDVFDVGLQTRQAIGRFLAGKPLAECASGGEWSNGNGSLMRVMPLALWHRGTDAELARDAMVQSRTTHGHFRSGLCCALYCLWARQILSEVERPWFRAMDLFEGIFPAGTPEREEYDKNIHSRQPDPIKGSGYVVDTLHSAVWAMEQGDFEMVLKSAISLGHDTDTTACVAGGVAGLRDGIGAVPKRWMAKLRGKELVEPLLEALRTRG